MAGLLSPESGAALALLGSGMVNGNFGGGLLAASQYASGLPDQKLKRGLLEMQIAETQAQAQERAARVAREQQLLELERRKREALPALFQQGGMTGGEAVPQQVGGVEMFSRPAGVTPMQATPGGFNYMAALQAGYKPEEIQALAGLQNIGRPKATRQMEVDDGNGGKRIALVDDYGREVAGFAGYTAPVQVNQGDRVSFVKPTPGMALPVGMSPSERDASARGWAGVNLQRQQAEQGKWQYDATRGGLVNTTTGEFKPATMNGQPIETKASREADKEALRQKSALSQADSVIKEVQDAKGLVGWNTAGFGGAMSVVPATDARNLSAKLGTIKANLGFDRLQQMRQESPTGGALGAVAVQELNALQSTVASLDQMQSPTELGKALDKIERHYTNWRNAVSQASNPQGGASGGWQIREKK
jgi:hypothetical protein